MTLLGKTLKRVVNALDWYPNAMKNLRDEQIPDYENTHTHKMIQQPAGVAVAYLAWNFPLLNVGFKTRAPPWLRDAQLSLNPLRCRHFQLIF